MRENGVYIKKIRKNLLTFTFISCIIILALQTVMAFFREARGSGFRPLSEVLPLVSVLAFRSENILQEENYMSTTLTKPAEVSRTWYILDAEGKPLGRVAAKAAHILRGKHKPTYTPNVDCGDHVIVINCAKAVLTGRKLEQKKYYWHTGWIGGLKSISYKDMMAEQADRAMMIAVNGMLPNNSLGRAQLKRLRTYKDANHKQEAQKPVAYEL